MPWRLSRSDVLKYSRCGWNADVNVVVATDHLEVAMVGHRDVADVYHQRKQPTANVSVSELPMETIMMAEDQRTQSCVIGRRQTPEAEGGHHKAYGRVNKASRRNTA